MKDDQIEQKKELIVLEDEKGQQEIEKFKIKNLKDSKYTQKLKVAQINEIEKYIKELKLELIQEKHKLNHSEKQQTFFNQQIEEQLDKIKYMINYKGDLKQEQNQYKQKINNCYNQIEIIAKELSKVDDNFLTFEILEKNQLEINEDIDRNRKIKEFIQDFYGKTEMEIQKIDINLRQLYIQFEQQWNFKKEQNKLVQLIQDEEIDKKKYHEVYENIIRNILKHLSSITRSSTINSQFNLDALQDQQSKFEEDIQKRYEIQLEQSENIQQMKKIQQNNKNIETQVQVCERRQLALKQKILQTQRKIEHQNQQIKIIWDIITQLETSEQTLSSKQNQIKSELSSIEKELQNVSFHSLAYNQQQKKIKLYKKNALTICCNINSVKFKLDRNRNNINDRSSIISKYQGKIENYLKQLDQSYKDLQIYKQSQKILNDKLECFEIGSNLLIQQEYLQQKITEKWQKIQLQLLDYNIISQHQQKGQVDQSIYIKELEAIKRDNILLLSMDEYKQMQSNLFNFINDLINFTQEHIDIEEKNHKNLQFYSHMLLSKIESINVEAQKLYNDMNNCKDKCKDIVKIDQYYIRIEFEIKHCLNYISDTQQQKILKQKQYCSINDEIENLMQISYDMENSLNHIRFQEESILKYIDHLEYQLTLQNQIYNKLIKKKKVTDKTESQLYMDSSSQFEKL